MQEYFRGFRSSRLVVFSTRSNSGWRSAPGGGADIAAAGRRTTGAAGPGGAFTGTAADEEATPLPAGGLPSCGGGLFGGGAATPCTIAPEGSNTGGAAFFGGPAAAALAPPEHLALFPVDSSSPLLSLFCAPSGDSITRGGGWTNLDWAGVCWPQFFSFCARSAATCGSSPSGKRRLSV